MFEQFGEFDSYKEINELAENLFNEQDLESLKKVAKENGIGEDYVQMYMEGDIPVLCDAMTAALGKIDVEVKELKPQGLMVDWVEYLKGQIADNEIIAFQVRKKGKTIKNMIGKLLKYSFDHQQNLDKDIIKAAGIKASRVTFGEAGMAEAKQIIKDYYMGK